MYLIDNSCETVSILSWSYIIDILLNKFAILDIAVYVIIDYSIF